MAVATWQEVAVALGRPTSDFNADQQAQITWWLDGVELIIGLRLGDVTLLNQDVLKLVEVEVVADKVRANGTEESSITVSVDDGSVTRRFENAITDDDIDDKWWDLLMGRRRKKAVSMSVSGGRLLR